MTPIYASSPTSGGPFSILLTSSSLSPSFPQSTHFNVVKAKSHYRMNGGPNCGLCKNSQAMESSLFIKNYNSTQDTPYSLTNKYAILHLYWNL